METCKTIVDGHDNLFEKFLVYLFLAELDLAQNKPKKAEKILDLFWKNFNESDLVYKFLRGDPLENTNLLLNYHLLMRIVYEKAGEKDKLIQNLMFLISYSDPLIESRKPEMMIKLASTLYEIE